MITPLLLTFAVFTVFWVGDFYLTIKVFAKAGTKAEANPLMKLLLLRGRWVFLFKGLEYAIFLYLIYFLAAMGSHTLPFYMLLVYIVTYSGLVANNSRVYYNVTGKQSSTLSFIFICTCLILVLFIHLNYLIYSGLIITYNRLMESERDYNRLNWACNRQNASANMTSDSELLEILGTLDIPIPRP